MLLFVVVVVVVFLRLGVWQLDRREERAIENLVLATRMAESPADLAETLGAAGGDLLSLGYRPVVITGTFRPDLEKLVRNRTNASGTAGFHQLVPVEMADGSLVVVNRGWIPLESDTVPTVYQPPAGEVSVTGFIRLSESRPPTGPVEPDGDLDVFVRIDLERIGREYPAPVQPVWIQLTGGDDQTLPIPLELPDTTDPGPHLSYAIQWFSFAIIAVIGFLVALGRSGKPGKRHLPPLD